MTESETSRGQRYSFVKPRPVKITARNLEFLATLIRMTDAAGGRSPKLSDLGKEEGITLGAVHGHLSRLKAAGYLTWVPGSHQGIRIFKRGAANG